MRSSKRYVFDTNVLISALLLEDSPPAKYLFAALDSGELVLSQPLVKEISEVLSRKKFDRYLFPEERERFLDALVADAAFVEVSERLRICRDPKDDKILELAVSAEAHAIVTGDADLLEFDPFRGVRILTPDAFLRWVE
jgi:putative PIN family toxin of toxin-antitoxin system